MFAYPQAMMRTLARLLLPLFAVAALVAASVAARPAAAQTTTPTTPMVGTIPVVLLSVGGATYHLSTLSIPLNKAQCDAGAKLSFQLTLPAGGANLGFIQVWQGNNCNAANTRTTTTSTVTCQLLQTFVTSSTDTRVTYSVDPKALCASSATWHLYFLDTASDAASTDEIAKFGQYDLKVDIDPPTPPTGVSGGKGETQIPVNWTAPAGDIYGYTVLWDTNVTAGGSAGTPSIDAGAASDDGGTAAASTIGDDPGCVSSKLRGGVAIDFNHLPAGVGRLDIKEKSTTTSLSADEIGASLNSTVAVAVVALDLAYNPSKLSNVSCVRVVHTLGFWDTYKANGGSADQGCAVSAVGHHAGERSTPASAFTIVAALLGVSLRARRKRS